MNELPNKCIGSFAIDAPEMVVAAVMAIGMIIALSQFMPKVIERFQVKQARKGK